MPAATYQGHPCSKGHEGMRYASTRACVDCVRSKGLSVRSGSSGDAKREDALRVRRATRAENDPPSPSPRARTDARFHGDTVAGLDALLDPAWTDGAYAVTLHHKGRARDGSPAGFRATVHATGKAYTTKEGTRAVPTVQHIGHGATAADALADAVARAAGVMPMA